jgi:hypothetical protein
VIKSWQGLVDTLPVSISQKQPANGSSPNPKRVGRFNIATATSGTMTGDQSRSLKVGDRVCWQNDQADQGTVAEKNWAGVTIKWDIRGDQAILHNDMAQVERVPMKLV